MIKVEKLHKSYGKNEVLKGISVEIKEKEVIAVIGPSGSGKSTLIKMLYREEKPDKGSIIIGGINVAKLKNRKVHIDHGFIL